jgi:2-keto-4-pentenoate hydratase/2-oxohepta-3-ene-1,7-dioic acid hydratase in catechol pathway
MKIVGFDSSAGRRFGIIEGEEILDAGDSLAELLPGDSIGPLGAHPMTAPVPKGAKIICVGLNYRDHAEESGQPVPESPILFAKFSNSVIGHGTPIRIPPDVSQADYEAELAVVIGREAKRVTPAESLDHVLGYTCLNDVSARDFQFVDGQWMRGKSPDTFCPIGPWIVTTDEIPDPQGLAISCVLNGETVQDSSTKQMVFGVSELVAFISTWITLEPGDVIATGTPPGVGFARKPQLFLQDGDRVEVDIEGIGRLSNAVVKENAGEA